MEMNTSTHILGHKVEVAFQKLKIAANCLQITTSFLSKSQSGLSVLNTTIATNKA